jgi:hypothetical protein
MGAPEWIARFQSLLAAAVSAKTSLVQAALRLPGFKFDETMRGRVSFTSDGDFAGEHDIVLQLRAAVPRFGDYLHEGRTSLTGTATLAGIADAAPVKGSLWIWPHRQIIRYELSFPVDKSQQRLYLAGQKDVRLLDFRHTMSTLPAKLFDDAGVELGHATVLFDWDDLPEFLRSFAPLSPKSDVAVPKATAAQGDVTASSHLRPA